MHNQMMNEHEQRRHDRMARLNQAADKKDKEAKALFDEARSLLMTQCYGGKKHDSKMRSAMKAEAAAKEIARRARAAEANTAISADDPDAVAKLEAKLEGMEKQRSLFKRLNADAKKQGESVKPVPGWELTNLGANIRRVRKRIEELKAEADRPEASTLRCYSGTTGTCSFVLAEDKGANRIKFEFNGKPCEEWRRRLKMYGFKWSPSQGVWQRQLNNTARSAAATLADYFVKEDSK